MSNTSHVINVVYFYIIYIYTIHVYDLKRNNILYKNLNKSNTAHIINVVYFLYHNHIYIVTKVFRLYYKQFLYIYSNQIIM